VEKTLDKCRMQSSVVEGYRFSTHHHPQSQYINNHNYPDAFGEGGH